MQACIYEHYGPADVVKVGEIEKPRVKADEVLVRVHATSVTTADWRFRAAAFPLGFRVMGRLMIGVFRPRNPVLGMDFSGVVAATGTDVTRFRVGERVFGAASAMRRGAHAEYVAVKESGVILHKPAGITDQEAAAIPFGGNSALAFLRDFGAVRAGQRVLIVGASGGVGVWAVQIARHLGAHVTGVCSTRNVELVRSLGAHRVVDYTSGTITETGEKYDLIFDTVGVTTFASCKDALSEKGTYLPLNSDLRGIAEAVLTSRSAGKRVKYAVSQNTREGLDLILKLMASGVLKPVIDRVYPMDQVAEAHRHVEQRHKRGSVVLTIAAETA